MATESSGTCNSCNAKLSKRQMLRHLAECAYPAGKDIAAVAQLRVDVPNTPFWIDLDVKANAPLRELDQFLRDIWLECCDHLSSFRVGDTSYVVHMDGFIGDPRERNMDVRVAAALPPVGSTFAYEYDFGSTTELRLKVIAHRQAPSKRNVIRLLARNERPAWDCTKCGRPATSLCAFCSYEDYAFVCEKHLGTHKCEDEAMLPVVNSPRMGVCGYTGD